LGNTRQALTTWNDGIDSVFSTLNLIKQWRSVVTTDMAHSGLARKYGVWNCILAATMATRTGFFVSDIGSLLGSSGHEGGADGADKQIQREKCTLDAGRRSGDRRPHDRDLESTLRFPTRWEVDERVLVGTLHVE
jgi:hypothetical protein